MVKTLLCLNVNDLYWRGMFNLKYDMDNVVVMGSRNGQVRTLTSPQLFEIQKPWQRVLFSPSRNANPTFHLMEAMWMLAGSNDVEFVRQYNSNMYTYTDNGTTFNAAYGYRWREHFKYDQILTAIDMLKANPDDRRVVISMWDPYEDLGSQSKDIPCNTQIMLRIVNGKLNMTTVNRSNDHVWGLAGANAVHLTVLQEYMAAAIGVPMGKWFHMTNNLHIYEWHWELLDKIENRFYDSNYAEGYPGYPGHMPLLADEVPDSLLRDCQVLLSSNASAGQFEYETKFFQGVILPMAGAWRAWKSQDYVGAIRASLAIEAPDWKKATFEWYKRALEKKQNEPK